MGLAVNNKVDEALHGQLRFHKTNFICKAIIPNSVASLQLQEHSEKYNHEVNAEFLNYHRCSDLWIDYLSLRLVCPRLMRKAVGSDGN